MKLKKAPVLALPYAVFALIFIVAPLILILFYSITFDEELDNGSYYTLPSNTTVTLNGKDYLIKEDTRAPLNGLLSFELPEGTVLTSVTGDISLYAASTAKVEDGTTVRDDNIGNFLLVKANNKNHCKQITLRNFFRFFDRDNPQYLKTLFRSLYLALISTVICLILGYPMAFILSRLPSRIRGMLTFLFILPMWMNFLLRTYAWMTILENTGLINSLLAKLGLPTVSLMYSQGAVILGMVYNFLPFMILPIYNQLIRIDNNLINASNDLGANKVQTFLRVVFPLSFPGVMSGITMTFMPAVTTFVISKLLGGGQNALIGDLIEQQFKTAGDWGFGSAISVIVMILMLLAMSFVSRYERQSYESGGVLN